MRDFRGDHGKVCLYRHQKGTVEPGLHKEMSRVNHLFDGNFEVEDVDLETKVESEASRQKRLTQLQKELASVEQESNKPDKDGMTLKMLGQRLIKQYLTLERCSHVKTKPHVNILPNILMSS